MEGTTPYIYSTWTVGRKEHHSCLWCYIESGTMLVLFVTFHMIHEKRDTDSLCIVLRLSSSPCLIYSDNLWNCHVDLEGNLKQAGRAGPLENLLLCSEAWSCAATTANFLVLIDIAHRTRNTCKLRFMCSAHDGESQTVYKYELGECLCVCVCVCVSHVA